jgi:polyhydroxyalkanoate synthase subunit PhaC
VEEVVGGARAIAEAWAEAFGACPAAPLLAQTPRDEYPLEGGAALYRFRGPTPATSATPILLVPSLINRWYVLDLRPGASLVEALAGAGFDVWLLDWGVPAAEDRYLDWDAVLRRLARATRRVLRESGQATLALLGYCMGGTLAAIHAAQHPGALAALVTLAAPIDFAHGGMLGTMVDRRWFDAAALADAGNIAPGQLQAGFAALRPTLELAKRMAYPELAADPKARAAVLALEAWAGDNIAFPAAAYRRYIEELYQRNQLVTGSHRVNGAPALLSAIRCPTLAIVATRDAICPPAAATALLAHVGTADTTALEVHGGHVGAVVGSKAASQMYPALIRWLAPRLSSLREQVVHRDALVAARVERGHDPR